MENQLLIEELKNVVSNLNNIQDVRAKCIIQNTTFIIDVYKGKQLLFSCISELNEYMLKIKTYNLKDILLTLKD